MVFIQSTANRFILRLGIFNGNKCQDVEIPPRRSMSSPYGLDLEGTPPSLEQVPSSNLMIQNREPSVDLGQTSTLSKHTTGDPIVLGSRHSQYEFLILPPPHFFIIILHFLHWPL